LRCDFCGRGPRRVARFRAMVRGPVARRESARTIRLRDPPAARPPPPPRRRGLPRRAATAPARLVSTMKPLDSSGRVAEVLRLGLVEGVAVRAIAKRLRMARKT